MSKKMILVLAGIVFFSSFRLAFASLIINEVMYVPVSKQWVEIYNDTDSDVDITQYKIKDAGVVNGHNISPALAGGSNVIPAHAYGVIAKDITSVNATYLFHSALGIAATGDTIILKNGDNTIDTVLVSENSAVNGDSLQLISGSWVSAAPTPGAINQTSTNTTTFFSTGGLAATDSTSPNPINTNTSTPAKNKIVEEPKIKTQIIGKTTGFVNLPLSLQALSTGLSGEQLHFGKYFWNFGDGDSKEINLTDSFQPFSHTYFYPGDYTITLDYYSNSYQEFPDASNQIIVKIIPADIFISRVGDEKDFFIELTNNTDYSADISNWILISEQKSFMIPRNTILASKKKIIISPKITGFSIADQNTLKLMTPNREVVFDFAASLAPVVSKTVLATVVENSPAVQPLETTQPPKSPLSGGENDAILAASAISSDIVPEKSSFPIIPIFSAIFIGAGAYGVYFIRQKRIVPQTGDDFKILDE
jgi:hypothetical protein